MSTLNDTERDATNMDSFREWLAGLDRRGRRMLLTGAVLFGGVWVGGALLAPGTVAGIERLPPLMRVAAALCFGGFAWPWLYLERNGTIQESVQRPYLLWLLLAAALPGTIWAATWLLSQKVSPERQMKRRMKALDRSQGHVSGEQLARTCAVERGIPMAYVRNKKGEKVRVGLEMGAESHIFSMAPTGRGKSLHLTDVLLNYPGAVLVVDPKGEQMKRTAAVRSGRGPIFRFPGHEICLADYYDRLLARGSVAELHSQLVRPWQDKEKVFAEKSLSLFTAAALYADAYRLDPVRILMDLAESDPVEALTALERVPAARRHVRVLTNGAPPDGYRDDRFLISAFGTFTTRLAPYQEYVDTIAPRRDQGDYESGRLLDPDWIEKGGTIYLTYDLASMKGAGGIIAAIIAGIVRRQVREQARRNPGSRPGLDSRLLVAVDELAHVRLGDLDTYLSTVRAAGIMFLLYAQSLEQLDDIYGEKGTEKIVGNCDHQLWFTPNTPRTGRRLSELYGKTYQPMPTQSASQGMRSNRSGDGRAATQTSAQQGASTVWREAPHLTAAQFMALPRDQVLVKLMVGGRANGRRDRARAGGAEAAGFPYIFIGERLNPIHLFDRLPGPEMLYLPESREYERIYTDWTAVGAGQEASASLAEPAATQGKMTERASEDAAGASGDTGIDEKATPAPDDGGAGEGDAEDGVDIGTGKDTDRSDSSEARGMF